MALTGLFAVLRWGQGIRSGAALWLLLVVVIVQIVSWVGGYLHHPQWMTDNPQIDRLAKWFLFIGLAWWLGGSTRATLLAWGLALVGLMAVVWLIDGNLTHWQLGLNGRRVDFGIRNAQHTALFFGAALIGLLCFARRCLAPGRMAWLRRLGWGAAVGSCLVGIGITQTRAVWLAMMVVLIVMAAVIALHAYAVGHRGRWGKPALVGVVLLVIAVVASGWWFQGAVEKRLEAERSVITQALEDDWKTLSYSSIGNRLLSWRASVEWIKERPLIGWGEEGRSLVTTETEWLPRQTRENYGHLHNTFLELLVSYGLLGVMAIGALVGWVCLGTWKAWRGGTIPDDMALFGLAFSVFYFIVGQFESYSFFWSGSYLQNLVLGGLVTHIWRWQVESGQRIFPATFRQEA
ncbi:O-antigen ligase [Halomonas fontilapidosi]|uniref:O-antigen ligase n=1 Tax=Halomonas fontilapidosi TaxID=616675 RepID=A0A7W5H0L8_9GAMM|nr:O-antigen ligase family protein [Halomonas fontilapidosi]MBB3185659.1 O-antigen ligase [Halomonas fontilapidosi]